MQDPEITRQIQKWLYEDSPRDIPKGAMLLFKVNRNRIFYDSVLRAPGKKEPRLAYELEKVLKARLAENTARESKEAVRLADNIAVARGIASDGRSERIIRISKRPDHDALPPEVRRYWVDNADLTRRLRECHTKMRLVNTANSSCPDSDRLMWAREVVDLDRRIRKNYYNYDHYKPGDPVIEAEPTEDLRQLSRKSEKLIYLNLWRYRDNHDPELGDKIKEWFSKILNPSEKLIRSLAEEGLVNKEIYRI